MPYNVLNTLNQLTPLFAFTVVNNGSDKIEALDQITAAIAADLVQGNLVDAALGGPGNFTNFQQLLQNIAARLVIISPQVQASGTFLPVATLGTNASAVTPQTGFFMRMGNVVHMAGQVNVTATAAGACDFVLTLPIASNMTGTSDLAGTMGMFDLSISVPNAIFADFTADQAKFTLTAITNGAQFAWYTYTYFVK